MEPSWKEVTIEYDGKIIDGAYRTAGKRTAGKKILVRSMRGVIKEAPFVFGKNAFAQIGTRGKGLKVRISASQAPACMVRYVDLA